MALRGESQGMLAGDKPPIFLAN